MSFNVLHRQRLCCWFFAASLQVRFLYLFTPLWPAAGRQPALAIPIIVFRVFYSAGPSRALASGRVNKNKVTPENKMANAPSTTLFVPRKNNRHQLLSNNKIAITFAYIGKAKV